MLDPVIQAASGMLRCEEANLRSPRLTGVTRVGCGEISQKYQRLTRHLCLRTERLT